MGAAMLAMNVLAYGFTLLAAHRLGPSAFGAVSALLGVVIVANVGALALQATAARRLATAPSGEAAALRRSVLRTGWALSGLLGVVLLAAVPLIDALLRLDDWLPTALAAATCVALTMMGGYAGVLQGDRRWTALAAVYVSMGLGRLGLGAAALAVDATPRAAFVGIAFGSLLPMLVGARLCGPFGASAGADTPGVPLARELWRNGHVLLAFFVLTNLDVLLARHLFSHHQAGVYAAGAIIAKACLFLPTFVLVVAFPTMAADRTGRAWMVPLLMVLAVGCLAVVATLLLPGLAQAFAGGHDYAGLGRVAWVFALEGTLFAALQIVVYDAIAGQSHAPVALWVGVVALAVLAFFAATPVASLAGLAAATAVVVGLLMSALPRRGALGAGPSPARGVG